MDRQYLTVTALNRYLKFKLDNDNELQNILLKAEISNFKRHSRGHLYLSLKDEQSQVSAIMFVSNTKSLNFNPKDGDKVIVEGYISVYEAYGTYQIYIQKMDLDGVGDLYLAYEKLKSEYNAKGYFLDTHKQKLPSFPKTIGVITSPTGAAVRDIINVINSRFPLTKIIIYPALVQGVNAKESIANQITKANQDNLVEVLIVGRGGGSIEDLWAFNEPLVIEAIYHSRIPLVSAVGHETDVTLADFVSDVRASTPSHAAEICVKNYRDVIFDINNQQKRLNMALKNLYVNAYKHFQQVISRPVLKQPYRLIETKELRFSSLQDRLIRNNPLILIETRKEKLASYIKQIKNEYNHYLFVRNQNYRQLIEKLELTNPLNIMKKGYAIIKQDQIIKKHYQEIDATKEILVQISGGEITAKISKMKGNQDE